MKVLYIHFACAVEFESFLLYFVQKEMINLWCVRSRLLQSITTMGYLAGACAVAHVKVACVI